MDSRDLMDRFRKERRQWKRAKPSDSPEIRWIIRGIDICILHLKEAIRDMNLRHELSEPTISKWLAKDLFHAVKTALAALHRGERSLPIRILEAAKEKVKRDTYGPKVVFGGQANANIYNNKSSFDVVKRPNL